MATNMNQGIAMGHPGVYHVDNRKDPMALQDILRRSPGDPTPYFDAPNNQWVYPFAPKEPKEPTSHFENIQEPKEGVKLSNPKQAFGDKKPPLHLIHPIAELHESAALHSGRLKYGENNYIETPVEAMTYVGAILRHVKQWVSGERVDAKELVHHLGAIRACTTILLTAEATGMLIDNRPVVGDEDTPQRPRVPYQTATAETFAEVERTIEHLNKLYPPKDKA